MLDLVRADFSCINVDFVNLVRLLSNMNNLRHLSVHDSRLGSLPTELGNLTGLTHLDLQCNSLRGSIPAELGNLHNLVFLRIIEHGPTQMDMTFDTSALAHVSYVQIKQVR